MTEEETERDSGWLLLEFPECVIVPVRLVIKSVGYVIGSLL